MADLASSIMRRRTLIQGGDDDDDDDDEDDAPKGRRGSNPMRLSAVVAGSGGSTPASGGKILGLNQYLAQKDKQSVAAGSGSDDDWED